MSRRSKRAGSVRSRLTPGNERKIAAALGAFEAHVDVDQLEKRIDFVRGDIVTRIEIDGKAVGDWSIEGSDRRHRWRNWLFKVPGDAVGKDAVECRQVAVAADRDINMFGLWFYQAME